ncbi:MAG TPA: hypothetical protein VMP01_17895 [Pirellulaceae bacterium]|nr:hypothetical protein [Pirellulaceae bacterium]
MFRYRLRTLLIAATLLPPYFSVLWLLIAPKPQQVEKTPPIIQPSSPPVWSLEIQVLPYVTGDREEPSPSDPMDAEE